MADRHLAALRGDEADLYGEHHAALRRVVAQRVRISAELVEEACQQAWMILLRRQPTRGDTLFAWLCTVAVREGYRLSAIDRRNLSLDGHGPGEADATVADQLSAPDVVDASLEARRALRALRTLPERQRRYMTLRVAGLSYQEIVQGEGVTYTNVNKHLAKASRRLRELRDQAA